MKNAILSLLLLLIGMQAIFGQNSPEQQEIIEISKTKWQWMADKDADKLAELFDDKTVFVHMGGSWGREREVDIIRSGGIWYKNADIHEVSVEIIDNTAILPPLKTKVDISNDEVVFVGFQTWDVTGKKNT